MIADSESFRDLFACAHHGHHTLPAPAHRADGEGDKGMGWPLQTHPQKSVANKRNLFVPSLITRKNTCDAGLEVQDLVDDVIELGGA